MKIENPVVVEFKDGGMRKWAIYGRDPSVRRTVYLHQDGFWRPVAWPDGHFLSKSGAEAVLNEYRRKAAS